MEVAATHDPRARLRRLHEAFTTMLDKTFETMPFEDFKDFFGKEFGNTHRDYLFDLYSSYISTTRSNSEEEFGVVIFQADLEDKLARLEELVQQQPESGGGVALMITTPAQAARAARMEVKKVERARLLQRLQELDAKNDELQPVHLQLQQQEADAAAWLRARKQEAAGMLSASSAIVA